MRVSAAQYCMKDSYLTRLITREEKFTEHRNRAGTDRSGPVPLRQIFSLINGDGTELKRDGDVPVSMNISV